jgi:hypothetical protein
VVRLSITLSTDAETVRNLAAEAASSDPSAQDSGQKGASSRHNEPADSMKMQEPDGNEDDVDMDVLMGRRLPGQKKKKKKKGPKTTTGF